MSDDLRAQAVDLHTKLPVLPCKDCKSADPKASGLKAIEMIYEALRAVVSQERERCISDVAELTMIVTGTDMACTETKQAAIAAIRARGAT